MKEIRGNLIGTGKKFAIVVSRFNEFISRKLLDGAIDCLLRHSVNEKDIDIYWVPGRFEIPGLVTGFRDKTTACRFCTRQLLRHVMCCCFFFF